MKKYKYFVQKHCLVSNSVFGLGNIYISYIQAKQIFWRILMEIHLLDIHI